MSSSSARVGARTRRLAMVVSGLGLVVVALDVRACLAADLSVFSPASPPAETIRGVFYLVLGISLAIFLLVEGLLVYCVARFRHRESDTSEPPQMYGSMPIEVAWTVGPAIIVFVLFLIVVRSVAELLPTEPPADSLTITVVGHQWWWEYRYLEQTGDGEWEPVLVTANELHVPQGRRVALRLESADVVHSFWVPRLNGKMDLIPGRTNHLWFLGRERGTYEGVCAEFCGTQHANMLLRVVVDTPEEFDQWFERQRQPAEEVASAEAGRKAYLALACVNCHTVRGTASHGKFGPDLTHLMSRHMIASNVVDNSESNLLRWVANPDTIKPGCRMPSMHLTEEQTRSVVDYLLSLR